jgi:hypothetical protein
MRYLRHAAAALYVAIGLAAAAPAVAADIPVITGQHWQAASEQERLAFLAGMATVIGLEYQMMGNDRARYPSSVIDDFAEELGTMTLKQIAAAVDAYYAVPGADLDLSVVEVLLAHDSP